MPATSQSQSVEVHQARWSLMTLFVLFGMIATSWTSRMPSVRAALGLGYTQIGALLVVGAVGGFLTVLMAGALFARFGTRHLLTFATLLNVVGFGVFAAGMGLHSVLVFAIGAFLNGICGALINTAINLEGAAVERHLGRAVLPHFHAGFSVGAGLGALIGAGFSRASTAIWVQVIIVTLVITVARLFLNHPATRLSTSEFTGNVVSTPQATAGTGSSSSKTGKSPRGSGVRGALSAWSEPRTVLIGVLVFASSMSEGSAGNWLSAAVTDGFNQRESIGAIGYGTFVVAMTAFRFGGTWLINRFGRVPVLRWSAVVAMAGLLLFALAPTIWWAWPGIVLWGAGAALGNPIAIAAASDDPTRAAARVSVVTSFGSVAQLTIPPVLGLLIDGIGERHALLTICIGLVTVALLAGQVRPLKPTGGSISDAATNTGAGEQPAAQEERISATPGTGLR